MYAETCAVTFLNSSALGDFGKGGSVRLVAPSPVTSQVRDCAFVGNAAGLKGGGVCWEGMQHPPVLTDNLYKVNTAPYGNDVVSFGLNFTLNSSATLTNVASGQVSTVLIVVDLVDHYGQVVTIEKFSYARLNSGNIAGTSRVPIVNGRFTFSEYSVTSTTVLPGLITLQVQMCNCTVGEALTNADVFPALPMPITWTRESPAKSVRKRHNVWAITRWCRKQGIGEGIFTQTDSLPLHIHRHAEGTRKK